jgi:ribose transport system substrate-binding protein
VLQISLGRVVPTLVLSLALTLGVAACGGGNSSSGSSSSPSSETGGSTAASEGGGAAAKAAEVVAPYVGHPSPFPVTEPLKKVPKGAHMIFADAGTPINALQWQLLGPAAQTMGVDMERITAGTSANTIGPAMDSVVAKEPEAVLVNAVPPELWTKQLKELQSAGVTITGAGITGGAEYGIEPVQGEEPYGKLMANYVIAKMDPKANVAIYTVPEIPVIRKTVEEFETEFEALCPECELRTVEIHASELGNTAPNTIVSDLQSHPETDVAVFGADEIQDGLPAARQAAGIEVETLGLAPTPTNLQYLKEGKETAGLAVDLAIGVWSELDQAARELTGQPLKGPETEGRDVLQFLTKEDITFDPSKGWSGYPDFAERFAKLWGAG